MRYLNKTETGSIPQRLFFIPIRDAVIFPNVVLPLFFQSEEAIHLLNQAVLENSFIGCVYPRVNHSRGPLSRELLNIGTACRILQLVRLPERGMKVFLEGVSRIQIENVLPETPYFRADAKEVRDPEVKNPLAEPLVHSIGTLFKLSLTLGRPISDEALKALDQIEHPGRLADLIALSLPFGLREQQEIFETVDPIERLKKAYHLFCREYSPQSLTSRLFLTGCKETGKSQRDAFHRPPLRGPRETAEEDPYHNEIQELRAKVQVSGMPEKVMEIAYKEIHRLERMNPISAEYTVSRTYLDYLIHMPWDKRTEDNLDLARAETILNEDHYGLEKVKDRILEFLAVKKLKNPMKGPILCFVGPPGVGKTSLGRSIARSLERKFIRISLGGVRDEAEIRGHRRTYVGALPGRIIQEIKRAGTSNPVFMLDEIDKIGQDVRGDPASALLEALDPEQNCAFTDHYLDVPFDLSHVLFITTANTLNPIPPALLDRMEVISIPGYTEEEKEKIALGFLIPRQKEENGLKDYPISFTPEAVSKIIREYTRESGVRNLEREIATICRKVAKEVAMGRPATDRIDPPTIERLLGPRKFHREIAQEEDRIGVATGLAWTETGGDILFIETTKMKGDKGLLLTGSLGEVMKESAQAAFSYLRANASALEIPEGFHQEWDIHIHVPSGATPKDGPSAGIAIATAVLSLLKGKPVPREVAMTGEVTLSGRVLPVGGIKEKVLAGRRAGVKTIILPKQNEKNLEDIPDYVKKEIQFVLVEHIQEVFDRVLPP
ncbi:MAG: endopeptidase La [Desulfobacterota bacterium]|nr:endopeptidase La [Thermodesulfobacteriota bacterium]